MLKNNEPLSAILNDGGWRSSSVLRYFVKDEVDQRLAANLYVDASDSDD
jgi:hypothetical protein